MSGAGEGCTLALSPHAPSPLIMIDGACGPCAALVRNAALLRVAPGQPAVMTPIRTSCPSSLALFTCPPQIIDAIGRTALVIEPWCDPSVLRRMLPLMEVVYTQRARTLVRGDALPGHPRGSATWAEEPGGEYGADREEAGDVTVPHRLELAMAPSELATFHQALRKDYGQIETLLAQVANVDLHTAECRDSKKEEGTGKVIAREKILAKIAGTASAASNLIVIDDVALTEPPVDRRVLSAVLRSPAVPRIRGPVLPGEVDAGGGGSAKASAGEEGGEGGEGGAEGAGAESTNEPTMRELFNRPRAPQENPFSPRVMHRRKAQDQTSQASAQARKLLREAILYEGNVSACSPPRGLPGSAGALQTAHVHLHAGQPTSHTCYLRVWDQSTCTCIQAPTQIIPLSSPPLGPSPIPSLTAAARWHTRRGAKGLKDRLQSPHHARASQGCKSAGGTRQHAPRDSRGCGRAQKAGEAASASSAASSAASSSASASPSACARARARGACASAGSSTGASCT